MTHEQKTTCAICGRRDGRAVKYHTMYSGMRNYCRPCWVLANNAIGRESARLYKINYPQNNP
jgi:late competence protein required for DNA uptake (superfamily II DNA/RNA helicase)